MMDERPRDFGARDLAQGQLAGRLDDRGFPFRPGGLAGVVESLKPSEMPALVEALCVDHDLRRLETMTTGGDTDTNAVITRAMNGSVQANRATPCPWRRMTLSCAMGAPGHCQPRPTTYRPDDAPALAETLLTPHDPNEESVPSGSNHWSEAPMPASRDGNENGPLYEQDRKLLTPQRKAVAPPPILPASRTEGLQEKTPIATAVGNGGYPDPDACVAALPVPVSARQPSPRPERRQGNRRAREAQPHHAGHRRPGRTNMTPLQTLQDSRKLAHSARKSTPYHVKHRASMLNLKYLEAIAAPRMYTDPASNGGKPLPHSDVQAVIYQLEDYRPEKGLFFDYNVAPFGAERIYLRDIQRRYPADDRSYIVAVGAAQTFGRGVEFPYGDLVGAALNKPCINLGIGGVGPSYFSSRPELLEIINKADLCLLNIMSPRSTDLPGSRPTGSCVHILADGEVLFWDGFVKRKTTSEGYSVEELVKLFVDTYIADYRKLKKQIDVPTIFVNFSAKGEDHNYANRKFPQYLTLDELDTLYDLFPNHVSNTGQNNHNELFGLKYYLSQESHVATANQVIELLDET